MTKRSIAIAALGLVLAANAHAQSGGSEDPPTETIARNCMACHGVDGISPGAIPTIYRKSADYLAERMIAFRDGKRDSTVMGRILQGFADDDIRKLAEYFAAEK